jgi:hypothetical protein
MKGDLKLHFCHFITHIRHVYHIYVEIAERLIVIIYRYYNNIEIFSIYTSNYPIPISIKNNINYRK